MARTNTLCFSGTGKEITSIKNRLSKSWYTQRRGMKRHDEHRLQLRATGSFQLMFVFAVARATYSSIRSNDWSEVSAENRRIKIHPTGPRNPDDLLSWTRKSLSGHRHNEYHVLLRFLGIQRVPYVVRHSQSIEFSHSWYREGFLSLNKALWLKWNQRCTITTTTGALSMLFISWQFYPII